MHIKAPEGMSSAERIAFYDCEENIKYYQYGTSAGWKKYEHNPELQLKGKLLPIPSNQKMNSYLKEIGTICNIHKNLTTHCARHTFATLAIEYGMPIDIIAKILGHTNTNMTRHYAKISEANISREMQRIGKVLTA